MSRLARRLTIILPMMTVAEALDTVRIRRVVGLTGAHMAAVTTCSCRAPHHTLALLPKTLNLKSRGRVVTVVLDLPGGFDPADMELGALLLEGVLPIVTPPTPQCGTADLMVKFSRGGLIGVLRDTDRDHGTIALTMTGLVEAHPFELRGTVRVVGQCP